MRSTSACRNRSTRAGGLMPGPSPTSSHRGGPRNGGCPRRPLRPPQDGGCPEAPRSPSGGPPTPQGPPAAPVLARARPPTREGGGSGRPPPPLSRRSAAWGGRGGAARAEESPAGAPCRRGPMAGTEGGRDWAYRWAETPSLGVCRERLDLVLGDMGQGVTLVVAGGWWDQVILEGSSHPAGAVLWREMHPGLLCGRNLGQFRTQQILCSKNSSLLKRARSVKLPERRVCKLIYLSSLDTLCSLCKVSVCWEESCV